MKQRRNPNFAGWKVLFTGAMMLIAFQSPVQATVIQAGIEHKEFLPPVSKSFKAGSQFTAPAAPPTVTWFPVPDWLAGAWLKNGDMETYIKDFRTGQETRNPTWLNNRVRLSFGHQQDARGTIWHAEILPFRADGNRGDSTDRRFVLNMNCLQSNPENVVLRFHSNVLQIDPDDGVIESSTQQEEIITFRPERPGAIATTSSTKTFDENGKPELESFSNTERTKLADFEPVTVLGGIDLRQSLDAFLAASNMTDRLPQSPNQQPVSQ